MAKVLVTGAGGCIGAWTLKLLRDSGADAVAFDLSDNRRRLELLYESPEDAADVVWETGDIADGACVDEVFARHAPSAVIHLAALQVPFCRADPAAGARANVVGSVNILESARRRGIQRIAYASSVAAAAMGAPPFLETLYGAYKTCNEQTARVYWRDWQTPSIGVRPSVVYGPARDQGMSAAPTIAMLAAVMQKPYTIPFTGPVGFVYAAEAAAVFIKAIAEDMEGAHVFDLNGTVQTAEETAAMLKERFPNSEISCRGPALPFPSDISDEPLRAHVGEYARPSFAEGMDETLKLFARRAAAGRIEFPA